MQHKFINIMNTKEIKEKEKKHWSKKKGDRNKRTVKGGRVK